MKKEEYKVYLADLSLALEKNLPLPCIHAIDRYRIEGPEKIRKYLERAKSHPIIALDRTCFLLNHLEKKNRDAHPAYQRAISDTVLTSRLALRQLVLDIFEKQKTITNLDYLVQETNTQIREHLRKLLLFLEERLPYGSEGRKYTVIYNLPKDRAKELVEHVQEQLGYVPFRID